MRSVVSLLLLLIFTFPKISWGREDPWWAKDKVQHFALSYISTNFLRSKYLGEPFNRKEAFLLTLSLGVGKELWDRFVRKKEFSFKDLCYDLLGSFLGSL
jgi:uncharacterized protein YfiM (DUF2279 family)